MSNLTDTQDIFAEERAKYFPMELPNHIVAKPIELETYFAIEAVLEEKIFPSNSNTSRWFSLPAERRDAKRRLNSLHRATHQETIVFYDNDTPIGYSAGRMTSATEFMMNDTGILPHYRRKGIYSAFLKLYLPYLRDCGYERVASYHSPTNRAILIAKLKAGFNISGMELREHVGASVKLAYFLHEDRFAAFENVHSLDPDITRGNHNG